MKIVSLKLEDFRNIEKEEILFDEDQNLIFGENASGKTSILEGIYICANGRSFRGKDVELVRHDRDFCRAIVEYEKEGSSGKVEITIKRGEGKWCRLNNKYIKKIAELLENIHVVLFSPDDLGIVKDSPAIRRSFLDREISSMNKAYYSDNLNFMQCLRHRNIMLKDIGLYGRKRHDELSVWDENYADKAATVIFKRLKFIESLGKISERLHQQISGGKETLSISYVSPIDEEIAEMRESSNLEVKTIKEAFKKKLETKIKIDLKRGFSTIGPHTDDLDIAINGKSAKSFGSQGQQRTAALSLKLAETELIEQKMGTSPVLLLDDILSELDGKRQLQLIQTFSKAQIIMTNAEDVDLFSSGKKIRISKGRQV